MVTWTRYRPYCPAVLPHIRHTPPPGLGSAAQIAILPDLSLNDPCAEDATICNLVYSETDSTAAANVADWVVGKPRR